LLGSGLVQTSYPLKLEKPSHTDILPKSEWAENGESDSSDTGESERSKVGLPVKIPKDADPVLKTELLDTENVDLVQKTHTASESLLEGVPDLGPDNPDRDGAKKQNDDTSIVNQDGLGAIGDMGILSKPQHIVDEKLLDRESKILDDANLIDEGKEVLHSSIDAIKQTKSVLESPDGAGALLDAADQEVSIVEAIVDSSLGKWDSSIGPSLEESALTTVNNLENTNVLDEVLDKTKYTVQDVSEHGTNGVTGILEEQDALHIVDEIAEVLEEQDDEGIIPDAGVLRDLTDDMNDRPFSKLSLSEIVETYDELSDATDLPVKSDRSIAEGTSYKSATNGVTYDGGSSSSNSTEEIAASLSSAASRVEEIELDQDEYREVKVVSNPKLTQEERRYLMGEALNTEGLKEWSNVGWEVVGMDFVGETEPLPRWEKAIVYLHLPVGAGNPPVHCQQGWHAVVDVSFEVGKVSDAGLPTILSHECSSPIILQEPSNGDDSAAISGARPSFVIAETDDVISNEIYGTAAYLKTPSYNSSIFQSMDSYVAFLLNQKWSTSPTQHMTQIGWLISTIEGCTDCGSQQIPKNNATLAFADSSVFGNLEAHRIPLFQWENDEELIAGTWCNEESEYTIWAQYGVRVFNHNTNIPCEKYDNDSKVSNSVFLENWNTAASSSWTDHIGEIEAHSAVTFRAEDANQNAVLRNWEQSTNEVQDCSGVRQTTVAVRDDLTLGKTAVWTNLHDLPPACFPG
jgi:hypothetical protein